MTLVLAHTDVGAIWMGGVVAYSGGFTFVQIGVSRDPAGPRAFQRGPSFDLSFSDGASVTAQSWPGVVHGGSDRLSLKSVRAYVQPARWLHHWSVRPLPPPGLMTFTTRWPEAGIEDTVVSSDTDEIRQAAQAARPIWFRR